MASRKRSGSPLPSEPRGKRHYKAYKETPKVKAAQKPVTEDVTGLETYEKRPRLDSKWLDAAKKATQLPIRNEGDWNRTEIKVDPIAQKKLDEELARLRSSRDVKKAHRREERKLKVERKLEASKQFASSHLSNAQRMELKDKYSLLMRDTSKMQEIIAEVNESINTDERKNLYLLNLLVMGLSRLVEDNNDSIAHLRVLILMLVSTGMIFKNILPSYKLVIEENETSKVSRKETRENRKFESHLLELYDQFVHRVLLKLMKKPWLSSGSSILHVKAIEFLGSFMLTARFTNFNDEYIKSVIDLVCCLESKSVAEILVNALGKILYEDSTLSLTGKIVPALISKVTQVRRKKRDDDFIFCPPGVPLLIKSLRRIAIGSKEKQAEIELQRRGIHNYKDLSRSRDKEEKKIDQELMKSVSSTLVHGDFKKFGQLKAKILTDMITFFVRILRAPNIYALPIVFETLRSLSYHAGYVNLELMTEIFEELKKLAEGFLKSTDYSGPIMLGAALAALECIKAAPTSLPLETDMSWIGRVISQAVKETLLTLECSVEKDAEDESEETMHPFYRDDSGTIESVIETANLTDDEFEKIVQHSLAVKKAWGSVGLASSHLSVPPVLLDLLMTLCGSVIHCQKPQVITRIQKLVKIIFTNFPGVKGVYDSEGVLISSLLPPQTVAYISHLMLCSQGVGEPELHSLSQSIQEMCQ